MQETKERTRVSRSTRLSSKQGTRPLQHKSRKSRASEKAPTSIERPGNDFLKTTFGNIIASEVGCGLQDTSANKDAEYLYKSVENYFRLLGKQLEVPYTGRIDNDAYKLYHALKENLPAEVGVNFDSYKGKLSVILFDDNIKFPDYTLFYLPICGIENMQPRLAEAFLLFLCFIQNTQKIDTPDRNMDFNYIITEWGEEQEEEERNENHDWRHVLDMRKEYESGFVCEMMSRIDSCQIPREDLIAQLDRMLNELFLTDFTHSDESIVEVMQEGLKLLQEDCIYNYDYCPLKCDDGRYYDNAEVMEFDRLFCFCWGCDDHDPVVQMAIEFYNNDGQNLTPYGPASWLALTPETDTLLAKSDWPTRFAAWYNKFYRELEFYM